MLSLKKDNLVLFVFALFIGVKLTGELLGINLKILLGVSFIIGLLSFFIGKNESFYFRNNKLLIFYFFSILMILSLSWTKAFEYGANKLFILYSILLTFFLINKKIYKNYRDFVLNFKIVYVLILSYIIVFQSNNFLAVLLGETIYRYRIVEGLNSNVVSVFFAFGALCFIHSIYFTKSRFKNIFNLSIILISLILLFLSGSRGAQIAFLGSIFLFFLFSFVKNKKKITAYLFGIIFTIVLLNSNIMYYLSDFMPSTLASFFESRYTSSNALESISAREELFRLAIDGYMSTDSFIGLLFGNGIGSYGFLLSGVDERGYPHNIFLEILYELGLVPLVLFLILVIKIIIKNYKETLKENINELDGMYLMFYFFLIISLSTGDLEANFLLFIYMIAILTGGKKRVNLIEN